MSQTQPDLNQNTKACVFCFAQVENQYYTPHLEGHAQMEREKLQTLEEIALISRDLTALAALLTVFTETGGAG